MKSEINGIIGFIRKFSRVGLSINVNSLIKKGNKQTLGNFKERLKANKRLGESKNTPLIDQVHRAMDLYQGTNRTDLLVHINKVADSAEKPFWRVLTSLLELLPAGCSDHKQVSGLLSNRDSFIQESKQIAENQVIQTNLFG